MQYHFYHNYCDKTWLKRILIINDIYMCVLTSMYYYTDHMG